MKLKGTTAKDVKYVNIEIGTSQGNQCKAVGYPFTQ